MISRSTANFEEPAAGGAEPSTVWGAIRGRAERNPDAIAIRTTAGTWSYGGFRDVAERVASGLVGLGVGRGDRVLIFATNSAESCVVWLACHRLGAAACLVSRKATTREVGHAVDKLRPRVIVGERARLDDATEVLASSKLPTPHLVPFDREHGAVSIEELAETPTAAIADPSPDDCAEVLFTSGTTSAPKAVTATAGRLLEHWLAVSRHYEMAPADVGYMVTPIHHQSGLRHVGLITWLGGGEVFVADGFHPRQVWSDVHEHRVTYTCMLDAMFQILVSLPASPLERGHALRLVVGVGDPSFGEECERRYGFEIAEVYGSTETGAPVTARLGMGSADHSRYRHAVPEARFCGWPLPGNEVLVAPPEGEAAAADGVGEIVVRSTVAADGYLDGPAYVSDPEWAGQGFRTGDRGVIGPDGALYFVGRSQDIIRRAGENISALEIEAVMNEHPGIVYAAVVGVPDPLRDEEVKAFVVPGGAGLDVEELWGWLADQLSAYKVPRYIDLCREFPMTESGKINKAELARGNATVRAYDSVAAAAPPPRPS
jgi:carnitine-CoA ligase